MKVIDDAVICTPVNSNRLWNCLAGYPNRDYIVSGFRQGFHIGMPSTNTVPVNNQKCIRKPTNIENRSVVIDKLNAELVNGRLLGPYSQSPLSAATYSPLYAIPKSEPGKYRLIHDLSKPKGCSVNDNIPNDLKSVKYCSVMQVAEFLHGEKMKEAGTYYMAKIDLKDAYRICPINKQDWKYLGMQYEDKLFIDICLPMGLGTSCSIFSSISDSLAWIFHNRNPECKFYNYIDDFLIVAPSEQICMDALDDVISLLAYLGFPISEHKTVKPCTHIEFLGLGLDSDTLSFFVPGSKRNKVSSEITKFLSSKVHRVNTIQKLIGKLNFLCQTFIPGKALMAGLYQSLAGVLSSKGWALRRINNAVRSDLTVWLSFLAQPEGKRFNFIFPDNSSLPTMTTDASGSIGYGCVFGNFWFSGLWDESWWKEQNIALLELIPIYMGVKMWHEKISNNTLHIQSDNESVVAMISTFFSKDSSINILLKDLALFCMSNNIVLQITHLPGKANVVADRLSRNLNCKHLLSDCHVQCDIPHHLQLNQIKSKLEK